MQTTRPPPFRLSQDLRGAEEQAARPTLTEVFFQTRTRSMLRGLCGQALPAGSQEVDFLEAARSYYGRQYLQPHVYQQFMLISGERRGKCEIFLDATPAAGNLEGTWQFTHWMRSWTSKWHESRLYMGRLRHLLTSNRHLFFKLLYYCDDIQYDYVKLIAMSGRGLESTTEGTGEFNLALLVETLQEYVVFLTDLENSVSRFRGSSGTLDLLGKRVANMLTEAQDLLQQLFRDPQAVAQREALSNVRRKKQELASLRQQEEYHRNAARAQQLMGRELNRQSNQRFMKRYNDPTEGLSGAMMGHVFNL